MGGMSKNPKRSRWWLADSRLWDALPALIAELKALEEFILEDGAQVRVTTADPKLQYLVKVVHGKGCFLAVNPTPSPRAATFVFPGLAKLKRIFDSRDRPSLTADPAIRMDFRPYEAKTFMFAPEDGI